MNFEQIQEKLFQYPPVTLSEKECAEILQVLITNLNHIPEDPFTGSLVRSQARQVFHRFLDHLNAQFMQLPFDSKGYNNSWIGNFYVEITNDFDQHQLVKKIFSNETGMVKKGEITLDSNRSLEQLIAFLKEGK